MLRKDFKIIKDENSLIYKVTFNNKKVSKSQIFEFNLNNLIREVFNKNISLYESACVIEVLSKIFLKKKKYLLEDCNKILSLIKGKISKRSQGNRRYVRIDSSNNSLVDYIDDEILEKSMEGLMADQHKFDDFSKMGNSLEAVRNNSSTLSMHGGEDLHFGQDVIENINNNNSLNIGNEIKKLKLVEDKRIELINGDNYTMKNRTVLSKGFNYSLIDLQRRHLFIPNEVENFFREKILENNNREIEMRRNSVTLMENDVIDSMNNQSISIERSYTEDIHLSLTEYGSNFILNDILGGKSAMCKAETFYNLLVGSSNGEFSVNQINSFSNIEVFVN